MNEFWTGNSTNFLLPSFLRHLDDERTAATIPSSSPPPSTTTIAARRTPYVRLLLSITVLVVVLYPPHHVSIHSYHQSHLHRETIGNSTVPRLNIINVNMNPSRTITESDQIYDPIHGKQHGPYVNLEYRLVFFPIPKVACTEWKRLLMRMNNNPLWCDLEESAHVITNHNLTALSEFSVESATHMMTSFEWTRAVFVREPKERILSAFLDKVIQHPSFWRDHCCRKLKKYANDDSLMKECRVKASEPTSRGFLYFLQTIQKYPEDCMNAHWDVQVNRIDEKWWPYINFIGYQDNMQGHARELLTNLYSSTKQTAWDRFGSSGWGGTQCENRDYSSNANEPFLGQPSEVHHNDAAAHLKEFYSIEAESIVETLWSDEWKSTYVHFRTMKLSSGVEASSLEKA